MLPIIAVFPLAQNAVTTPSSIGSGMDWSTDPMLFVGLLGALLAGLLILLVSYRRKAARDGGRQAILIDGSNVMHWQDNTPRLEPVQQVVRELLLLGLKPGVVFDANVGYKLTGRYLGARELSRLLALPRDQILVVPKGTQADPYLLETARGLKAQIVTNDRYRDWVGDYPELARAGALIRGGMQDGRVWLKGFEAGRADEQPRRRH